MLDGHVLGLGLALEDLDGHLAGHPAQLLVVDAVGGQAAVLHHALLAHDGGQAVVVGDHGYGLHARSDGVVGGTVDDVHLADHGLHHLLDLVGAGDGVAAGLEAVARGRLLGELCLHVGVGLRGAVEDAHVLGVGEELHEQVELVGDGREVRGARDVGGGLVVVPHEAGGSKVGDGGAHDGDVRGGTGHGLRGGRGDGQDEVVAIVHELGGDGLAGGLVVLGVLLVDGVRDAALVQCLHEALVGVVEGVVLRELEHADLVGLVRAARGSGARTAGKAERGQSQEAHGLAARDVLAHENSLERHAVRQCGTALRDADAFSYYGLARKSGAVWPLAYTFVTGEVLSRSNRAAGSGDSRSPFSLLH